MKQAYGENPKYDAAVAKQLEAARARHSYVELMVDHERKKEQLRAALDAAHRLEADARAALEQAKAAVRRAKTALAHADTGLRADRRKQNASIQAEAAAAGQKTYTTGTPCRNGHFSPRYTSSGACVMCDKIGWQGGKLRAPESDSSAQMS